MKTIFAALSTTLFIGISFAIVSAQMGGMMPRGMCPGGGPWNIGPGMTDGQWDGRDYESNGERIFFTGINNAGERIRFSGGPAWLRMHGGGCASCHGADGRGGFPVMMGTQIPPNITYKALIEGKHEHVGEEAGEEHEPYTDELIKRAITKGLEASGEPLDLTMPRWQMNDNDLSDLIDYLKTLSAEEEIGEEVNEKKAKEIAQEYLSSLNFSDLTPGELVEYSQSFVVKYQEKSTGRYAFDVLIDKRDREIYPAMGPTIGWNTKYGHADGMMGGMRGGMMGNFLDIRINLDEAQRLAQRFLSQNNLQMTLKTDHLHPYYGFYEFHLKKDGKPAYLIAVNGYTGQVLLETWLGPIVNIIDLSKITVGDLPQIFRMEDPLVPRRSALLQNYPNPFNPETWIPYKLQEDSEVTVHIYTVAGQSVRTLSLGYKPAGIYTSPEKAAYWDGRDSTGQRVSSGVYFYSLGTKASHPSQDKHDLGYFEATRKLIIQK